jgi:hypothetical protein
MDFHDHFGKGPDVHVEVDALIEKVRQLHHF